MQSQYLIELVARTAQIRSIELARCKHCGEPAGLLRRRHSDCEQKFQLGKLQIAMEVVSAASVGGDIDGLPSRVAMVAHEARVSKRRLRTLIIAGWIAALNKGEYEEQNLIRLQEKFGLTQAELAARGRALS